MNELNTGLSIDYSVGNEGEHTNTIFDQCKKGLVFVEGEYLDIPHRPLKTLIIDENSLEEDEYGLVWAKSNGVLVELFHRSDDETEYELICDGYREVFNKDDSPVCDNKGWLYCEARILDDEIEG